LGERDLKLVAEGVSGMAALTEQQKDLFQLSEADEAAKTRVMKWLRIGMKLFIGVALVFAIGAGVAAWWALKKQGDAEKLTIVAKEQAKRAKAREKEANSRRLAALAGIELNKGKVDLALSLSVEAWNADHNAEAKDSLFTALRESRFVECLNPDKKVTEGGVLSPDGKWLAFVNEEGVLLWDVAARRQVGEPFLTPEAHRSAVGAGRFGTPPCVAFSPDARLLAARAPDGSVNLWHVESRESPEKPLRADDVGVATCLAFSWDGKFLAIGGSKGGILLWDLDKRKRKLLQGHHLGFV
jgi:hypothetical protein